MEKLVRKGTSGGWEVDPERLPEAVERLGRYEYFLQELKDESIAIGVELEKLRAEGKERTVHFRELMAKKLTDRALLLRLEEAGLLE